MNDEWKAEKERDSPRPLRPPSSLIIYPSALRDDRLPAHPPDFGRVARLPSIHAPRADEFLRVATPDPAARSLADVADLDNCFIRNGRLVGASLSGRAFITLAGRFPPLTHVKLVAVTPFVAELAACPHLASVQHLDVSGCRLGAAGVAALLESPHLSALKSLDLGRNDLGRDGVRALAGSPAVWRLSSLGVAGNGLTAADLGGLAGVGDLDLSDNPVGPAGWQCLAAGGTGFGRLALARCGLKNLDHSVFPVVADALDLGFNALGDAAVGALAGAGAFDQVRALNLAGNRLSAAGVEALAGQCPWLAWLGQAANFLPPEALRVFLDGAAFPALRRVELLR